MSYQKYYVPDQSKYPIFMAFAHHDRPGNEHDRYGYQTDVPIW